jgi:hypothetical protein
MIQTAVAPVGYIHKKTGTPVRKQDGQGRFFKDPAAFINQTGVCYVCELHDTRYTYADFVRIAQGRVPLAQALFEMVDWQSPEALLNDFIDSGEPLTKGM